MLVRRSANAHFGAALPAGAALDESAGADVVLDGDDAGGLSPPHAMMAPSDITAARSATIAIFFMIVFLQRSRATLPATPTKQRAGRVKERRRAPYASALPEPSIARRFHVVMAI
jgi:preprotein translocase subunit SecY